MMRPLPFPFNPQTLLFLSLPLAGIPLAAGCGNEVSEATKQLQDADPAVRQQGARRLAESDEETAPSLPELQTALDDPDPKVRRLAARALGRMGAEAKNAVPALENLLTEDDDSIRLVAALSLVNIDPENAAPVDVLGNFARHGDPRSIVALGQLGPTAAEAVPALVQAMQSGPSLVQLQAIRALEKIGPAAETALPALSRMARSRNVDLREAAQNAKSAIADSPRRDGNGAKYESKR